MMPHDLAARAVVFAALRHLLDIGVARLGKADNGMSKLSLAGGATFLLGRSAIKRLAGAAVSSPSTDGAERSRRRHRYRARIDAPHPRRFKVAE